MLSVKQESVKYYFVSFWYDSNWDWTPISRTIGEHSNHYANGVPYEYKYSWFVNKQIGLFSILFIKLSSFLTHN